MDNIVIPSIVVLVIIIIICLYLISRYKQQAVQVITLESFMNTHHLNEEENQKESIMDLINEFFDDNMEVMTVLMKETAMMEGMTVGNSYPLAKSISVCVI